MSAWVEVNVKGDRRAYVNAGAVAGVMMPKGANGQSQTTETAPLMLIMQGGETFPDVFGMSADEFIGRCDGARTVMRSANMDSIIVRQDGERVDALYLMLARILEARHGGPA